MFFKVVTLTVVLLVQITYQRKLMSRKHLKNYFDQSEDYHGYEKSKNDEKLKYLNKLFDNNRFRGNRNSHQPRFFESMNFIIPDHGLRYPEDHQPRRLDLTLTYPGFHNLIEVRGPIRNRYIPKRLKEYDMPQIHKQNRYRMNTPYHIPLELRYHQPKLSYQIGEVSFSKEGLSIRANSHKSNKQSRQQYITTVFPTTAVAGIAGLAATPSNTDLFAVPELFEKIDPLPFKQVKRNQYPDSDEDEDDDRPKYLEFY